MANYTMTLKEMLTQTPLFDFDYTFESEYITKSELENLIISTYLYYEIGSETIERFKQMFIIDYLLKLNNFIEKINNYDLFLKSKNNNRREYGVDTNKTMNTNELTPPMSLNINTSNYSTKKDLRNDNIGSTGWETVFPVELYQKIDRGIKNYLYEFIYSLSDNFMGVF